MGGKGVPEIGDRVHVERHDFEVEGEVVALGFDPMRGNWLTIRRDDGGEVKIAERVRIPYKVTVR